MYERENNKRINKISWKEILLIILFCFYVRSVNYLKKNISIKYDLVIPTNNINTFLNNKDYFKKFLKYSKIILISPSSIVLNKTVDDSILFINEDSLIKKQKINEFLIKMRSFSTNRDGWYEQQFLKMAYSRICKNEYYLIWDCDTIPIKPIEMFENGKPIFGMKEEHHIPYFQTINRLFPLLNISNGSYISEHMIIKTQYMKNLIDQIEANTKLSGQTFWEKILMAIDGRNIHLSGFSEYELYGTYVDNIYPNYYIKRNWHSVRNAKNWFGSPKNLDQNDINWLSQYYYALTFENFNSFNGKGLFVVKNKEMQKKYKPNEFFTNYYLNKNNKTQFNQTK